MSEQPLPANIRRQIRIAQKNEITEYHVYARLARNVKQPENGRILQKIADDERRHADFWTRYTGVREKPDRWKTFFFYWMARIFGIVFGIKLLERNEEKAQLNYSRIADFVPGALKIRDDENAHEMQLIGMIDEERLRYAGSIVLGLNDALVELTGALAGLTLALQNTRLIALSGLITGIAASFSMAASEYLSTKAEGNSENAVKASIYTGIAYIFTVMFLVLPYLLIANYFVCLALTLVIAIFIIFFFNFYISVAKDYDFKKRFFEMAGLSMGIALLSFGIGILIRVTLGVSV